MADGTAIEWTDATWNVITGCSVTSPGCTNCYAMKLAGTRLRNHSSRSGLTIDTKAGPVWNGQTRFNESMLDQPLRWRRPRKIFVCAHGDLFHESVPDEWIDRVFAVMALSPQHTFQVLTKRADRMREYLRSRDVVRRICRAASSIRYMAAPDPDRWPNKFHAFLRPSGKLTAWTHPGGAAAVMFERQEPGRDWPSWVTWPLPNVWLGVSVEDQARANERIPHLIATPAAMRWLSMEPLLGPVDLCNVNGTAPIAGYIPGCSTDQQPVGLDWIVLGGESGPGARPMHPDWARSVRDQCAQAGVSFLFKQWGEWEAALDREREDPDWRADYTNDYVDHGKTRWLNLAGGCGFHGERFHVMRHVGKKAAGRLLDGVQHDAFPLMMARVS